MKTMFEIKREARRSLRAAYWPAFLICLVAFMLSGYIPEIGRGVPITKLNMLQTYVLFDSPRLLTLTFLYLIQIFLVGPLTVGRAHYFLRGIDGDWSLRHFLSPIFSRNYSRIVFVMGVRLLLISIAPFVGLVILILWNTWVQALLGATLLIIGIFVYYRQRLTPYLLAENPMLRINETMHQNKLLRKGCRRGGLFVIDFSFITWYLVGAILFGVGQFFFMPYHAATMAARYREISYLYWYGPKVITQEGYTGVPHGPLRKQYQNMVTSLLCFVTLLAFFFGLLPVTLASANTATDFVVTTEQELREAVEQNRSPIRIDVTIELNEGTIDIEEGQDILLKGTGTLIITCEGRRNPTRHFAIFGGRLTLQDELCLTRDINLEYGGGIEVTYGYFIMEGGRIENNRSHFGGGVQVRRGSFQMLGGVIRDNQATFGGGVSLESDFGEARFFMTGGEISGNTAGTSGGGVRVGTQNHFVMHGGQITGNRAERDGGGVELSTFTTFSMTGGEISYNHADGLGGAIGVLVLHHGYDRISIDPAAKFYGNTAEGQIRDSLSGSSDEPRTTRGSFGLQAGLAEYPQIRWHGENSRPGTHLINNYDIAYAGIPWPTAWQAHVVLAGIILAGKGLALIIFLRRDKKARLRREDSICNA